MREVILDVSVARNMEMLQQFVEESEDVGDVESIIVTGRSKDNEEQTKCQKKMSELKR